MRCCHASVFNFYACEPLGAMTGRCCWSGLTPQCHVAKEWTTGSIFIKVKSLQRLLPKHKLKLVLIR